ncbi:MAG: phenylalanine 4-monooxygenase [Bryobacterales bacterium]|nr:phenylalanine 4-monooxygenase [Bryobacterales bacterium]
MTILPGLTTTQAPFIEQARSHGELYIHQPYELYSDANHDAWRSLFRRIQPLWRRHATGGFLRGVESLCLDPFHVPRLEDINRFLEPLTGFRARAVSGYVPAFLFFDSLRNREFPTTITIRGLDSLDYLPEPDIFHDVAGHVPMHTDRAFADTLVRFGDCAHTASEMASAITNPIERAERLNSIIKAMARFFWFTVEFGLMNTCDGLKAYGSGLLSSHGELGHAVTSPDVQRYPIQMDWAINQSFEIDHYQPLLFVVEGFEHLYHLVGELEEWMRAGRLNHVAPGEPVIKTRDIESFIQRQSHH